MGSGDVVVGYMANPSNPGDAIVTTPVGKLPNAVQVKVQRTSAQNGKVPFFFAKVLGYTDSAMDAQATAAFVSTIGGFKMPSDGSNLMILPYALDEGTWNTLSATGTDNYSYNTDSKTVTAGGDGIKECNLFPQSTGAPGNRGTVDIGGANNSTSDLRRQITSGINQCDMDSMTAQGRSLTFSDAGELYLNGDTGISAGVKDELAAIIGQTRIIPIFRSVTGNGNNAEYKIVKFVGVRILAVKLTGSASTKNLTVQPANIVARGTIYKSNATSSDYVYTPVWLVR